MANDYTEATVSTPYGDLKLCLYGRDEVRVFTPYESDSNGIVTLTINRVAYRVDGTLWIMSDGTLNRSRTSPGGRPEYNSGWSLDRKGAYHFNAGATDKAREIFHRDIVPAVEAFLKANPDIRREAELSRRQRFLASRKASIKELEAQIETYKEDAVTLLLQIRELSEGGAMLTQDEDRCAKCFGPLTQQSRSSDGQFEFHCHACGRDAKALPVL